MGCLLGCARGRGPTGSGSREGTTSGARGGLPETKHGPQSLGSELPPGGHGLLGNDRRGNYCNDGISRRQERFERLRGRIEERNILDEGKSTLRVQKVDRAGKNNGQTDRPKVNGNQAGNIVGAHARKPLRTHESDKDGQEGVSHAAQPFLEEINQPKNGQYNQPGDKADGSDNGMVRELLAKKSHESGLEPAVLPPDMLVMKALKVWVNGFCRIESATL